MRFSDLSSTRDCAIAAEEPLRLGRGAEGVVVGAAPSHAVARGAALPALAPVSACAALSGQSIVRMLDFPYPCDASPGVWFVHPSWGPSSLLLAVEFSF